ncbi:bifunctional protein-serine/threonine kinase/phosphatase [Pseudooceanicola sediminis]|uniref:Bifunctional protein-serine/threonine kinase/phosphatase n=1 Tax=Pseudooceanicola sediminis TaxID=2211117 RepID=A0A399IZH9_9RHOB|nr:bifunctional protein-serine/threonine kinase/phosphatase [Puniceibacterium sp. HSS470]RII37857.1 bifunctional protein-serine/threonine kinase/phosphatase [Pseudooceanicola sediminis]|tara:strand:+ start:39888 stop:41615 length:1728 start_codon:yes stop_codon:yes gene_type:complete
MPKDAPVPEQLSVSIGQYSAAGLKPSNQDFHGAMVPDGQALALKGVTLALADGISSSEVSHLAARTSVRSLLDDYYCTSDAWSVRTAATRVIAATNAWLYAENARIPGLDHDRGQVCTLAVLILKGAEAHVLHVGDSRVWRLSGESLEPLTADHRLTHSSTESYLDRAIGLRAEVEVDYTRLPLARGDIYLLTTDGVHDHMEARFVARTLREVPDLTLAARLIAKEALARGSTDNLTIQIARIDALPTGTLFETSLPVPQGLRAGNTLDGYTLLRQIHANHRSTIFLATDPAGARVALKIPAAEIREESTYMRQFLMEEWIARRITSAHVLRAATPPARRSALYVVTEFVEGVTLRQWMTDHPHPSLDQVRDIVGQAIRGLRTFHRSDMLHQDLRPENIMIDRAGTVKIIDLGAARVAGVQEAAPVPGDAPILGTLQYAAPEYFSGDPVGWRADLFSLGVIAYEMLTHRLPYGTQVSKVRTRRDVARLGYRSARDDDNGVPDWLDEALRRACHPDASRRFDALSEFDAALRSPGAAYGRRHPVPLAQRHPLRFWQGLSALLALLCLILLTTVTTP